MFFYFLIFLLIIGSLFIPAFTSVKRRSVVFAIAIIFILIAGLRTVGVDLDSVAYSEVFDTIGSPVSYFTDYSYNSFYEPAYYLILSLLHNVLELKVTWFFMVFAVIGVSIKLFAITRLTDLVLLSVLMYYSHFFILHEFTQVRAGVASGILLLSIIEIERKNFLRFSFLILIGMMFHYSLVVFFPFYFLSSKNINKKFYVCLLILPFVLHFTNFNIITILLNFNLGVFSEKIQLYNDLLNVGVFSQINIFNSIFLVQLFLCGLFLYKSEILYAYNKYALILLKVYCFAAASLVFFSNIPVLAIRISELLFIVQIILVPFLLYIFKPSYFGLLLVIVFSLGIISINLIYIGILKPYFASYGI